MNELIAVRLFTGPGFHVINEFLRQLALLTPTYRARIARQLDVTYSSTCLNLVSGVRKLARFTSVPSKARTPTSSTCSVHTYLAPKLAMT